MQKFPEINCEFVASLVGGELIGSYRGFITGINRLEDAVEGELTFISGQKYLKYLNTTKASCILVPIGYQMVPVDGRTYIYCQNPYLAIVKILNYLNNLQPVKDSFIHPTAIIGDNCHISESAYIGPYCIIGNNCEIGENSSLHSFCVLYDNVKIGINTKIQSSVTICEDTEIGNECLILPGAVIGSEGFGFIDNPDGSYTKIPQMGNVKIGNRVEIGANTTIDRSMIGSTIIEDGVKLDNLIMVAHNVKIGENSAMASQVGISGSVKIGKRNKIGGQVGFAGHLDIADDVIIMAQSGIRKSVEKSGVYFGSPIREKLKAFKIEAVVNQLPELYYELEKLKKKVKELEESKE